jgi:hypothetical protein
LPIVVVATLPVQKQPSIVAYPGESALVPVDRALLPLASGGHVAVQLTWPSVQTDGGEAFFYTVFRSPGDGSGGVTCDTGHGAKRCTLVMQRLASSSSTSYLDFNPEVPEGKWTYRIGLNANSHADPNAGGLVALSPPVDVIVH